MEHSDRDARVRGADTRRHIGREPTHDVGALPVTIRGDRQEPAAAARSSPGARSAIERQSGDSDSLADQRAENSVTDRFQRAGVTPSQTPPPRQASAPPPDDPPADGAAAADGFLINGSVNNGAASPFAQPAAFGNNRRRPGALYNGMIGGLFSNSMWDARPLTHRRAGAET